MANTIPDDLMPAFKEDVYAFNSLTSYANGGVELIPCLITLVAAMHQRHLVMVDQLKRCRDGQKPYWAGDGWMPPEEGAR